MYTITYDAALNRLTVKVQEINKDNVNDYITDFTKSLESVKPGFTGMTDLSEGKLFTMDVAEKLSHLGQLSVDKGLTKWAYYTGSAVSKLQMKRMFGDVVDSFEKLDEAEAFLQN
ncbi:hypothetical protein J23TS9_37890 [Paenibacillus sp. J23TS9]|uniref:hypothetical protein n=1 Tax=Paenibacillus TaxID=44249 RepID=UPI0010A79168|nr:MULTISPECIES: hypothetical protein [Paenibacillus]GIP28659.1 hypothetical protein J23TS9_37890 [Paenibacillus sp. J23TS9]